MAVGKAITGELLYVSNEADNAWYVHFYNGSMENGGTTFSTRLCDMDLFRIITAPPVFSAIDSF